MFTRSSVAPMTWALLLVGGAVYGLARLLHRSGAGEPSTARVDA